MTRLWIDTEFNEHANRHELISLALVAEDGREWYEVLPCHRPGPWVAENVMPKLGKAPIQREHFAESLREFLAGFDSVHVVGDWPTDIALFCDALIVAPGTRIDTPPLTLEVIRLDGDSADPHNALADARGIRDVHLASLARAMEAEGQAAQRLGAQPVEPGRNDAPKDSEAASPAAAPAEPPEPVAWIPTDALEQLKPPRLRLLNVPLITYSAEGHTPLYALAAAAPVPPAADIAERRIAATMALVDEFASAHALATNHPSKPGAARYRGDVRKEIKRCLRLIAEATAPVPAPTEPTKPKPWDDPAAPPPSLVEQLLYALKDIYATVKGECSALLDGDRGGSDRTDEECCAAMAAAEAFLAAGAPVPVAPEPKPAAWMRTQRTGSSDWDEVDFSANKIDDSWEPLYRAAVPVAPPTLPSVCYGKEQDAFEAWAKGERYDMGQHPIFWLFLDPKTYSARQGWKAAIEYYALAAASAPVSPTDIQGASASADRAVAASPSSPSVSPLRASIPGARPFPIPIYRDPAGDLWYDAPHEAREVYTIRIKTDGVFYGATCDQEPGFYAAGRNPCAVAGLLAGFEATVAKLHELNAASAAAEGRQEGAAAP